jgi:HK97 family phage portal protein
MGARDLLVRALRTITRAVEGEFRPGPYWLPISGGWLPDGADINWWQQGHNILPIGSRQAIVEACVSAYAQTAAMCPGAHWLTKENGGRDRVTTSSLSRVLKKPNAYQTMSDFLLNAVRQLYLEGNAYALALRNDRFEITELHLMDSSLSYPVAATTGDVFYHLHGNTVIEYELGGTPVTVPQRDVLHIRLHADRNRRYPFPLRGITPLIAALTEVGLSEAIVNQQNSFYLNQARPSSVLSTDLLLDKDQVQALRDRWDEQSKGINQGKTPILTAGLKVQPWGTVGKDAQIAEVMKIAETHIALVFRIPLQVLGLGGHTFASTEALMQFWIATGLGFCLNHVEEAFGQTFALKGGEDEYVEFSTDALLRSAEKDRIDALARGVTGGIYSPNEARNKEGLPSVKDGDEPRLQAQVVPLSQVGKIPPASTPPTAPSAEPEPKPKSPPSQAEFSDAVKRQHRQLLRAAGRAGRHYG